MEVGFSPWGCKETQLSDFSLCVAGEVGKVGIGIQLIHMWMRDLFPLGVCFPTCEMGRWTTFSSYQTVFQGLGAGKTRGRPRVSKSSGPALSRAALLTALQFFLRQFYCQSLKNLDWMAAWVSWVPTSPALSSHPRPLQASRGHPILEGPRKPDLLTQDAGAGVGGCKLSFRRGPPPPRATSPASLSAWTPPSLLTVALSLRAALIWSHETVAGEGAKGGRKEGGGEGVSLGRQTWPRSRALGE